MNTYDTALFVVFRDLARQSLSTSHGALRVKSAQVLALPGLPAWFFSFELEEGKPTQVIGYLSSGENAQDRATFNRCADALCARAISRGSVSASNKKLLARLESIDKSNKNNALELLLDVFDGKQGQGGVLRFSRTLAEEDLRAVFMEQPYNPSSFTIPEGLGELDFGLAALDVLYGAIAPYQAGEKSEDTFELIASTEDPYSTLLIINVGHDKNSIIFFVSSEGCAENEQVENAIVEYLDLRAAKAQRLPEGGTYSEKLRVLDVPEAFERLGRLLGEDRTRGLVSWDVLVSGPPNENIVQKLKEFSLSSEDEEDSDGMLKEDEDEDKSTMFEELLPALKSMNGEPIWSEQRERDNEPRVEVLSHKAFPDTTILVSYSPHLHNISYVFSVFVPDTESLFPVMKDLKEMLSARAAHSDHVLSLKEEHPFVRLDSGAIEARLVSVVDALSRKEGVLCEYLQNRAQPSENSPRTPKSLNYMPGRTLH